MTTQPPHADDHATPLLRELSAWLGEHPRVVVCLSGGVDSAVLAAAAQRTHGERSMAVTGVSASLPAAERSKAAQLCQWLGLVHREVATFELDSADYAANSTQRCFFCKTELFDRVRGALPLDFALATLVEGTHRDDLEGHRPGQRAAHDLAVRSPYLDLHWRKAQVRAAAAGLQLPAELVDKPSAPCLSSRLPFGTRVTRERLAQVEAAERVLHARGYRACRVRHHEAIARLELPLAELPRFLARDAHDVAAELRRIGFTYTTVDVLGLRSGSMHEALDPKRRGASDPAGAPGAPTARDDHGAHTAPNAQAAPAAQADTGAPRPSRAAEGGL